MRNLKRVLSLALASVMLIGMMVVGASAVNYDDFSDKDKIVNKEAVSMLVELGVIAGKDDGTYDPTGIVTRAEMAKMICTVLNGGNDPQLGATPVVTYTDTLGHWAAPYIEYCSNLGIVAGRGDGTFAPNETVTGSQAAKMLLVAAGYQSAIEGFTGANWEVATNVRANQVGLYKDLKTVNPSDGLTRDNAAQMVYNALNVTEVSYKYTLVADGKGGFNSVTELVKGDETVLEDKFGAVKVEGVVIANEYAKLDATAEKGAALDAGKTTILVDNYDDQETFKNGENTFSVATGKDQLGKSVTLYVKSGSTASKATVLGNVIISEDNKVVTDTSSDSIATVADDNKLDIVSGTMVAVNYGNLAKLSADDVNVASGYEKVLIDNNDDGKIDYVFVNNYEFGKVTAYSTKDDGSITVGAKTNFKMDDAEDVVGFEDVAKNDYVLAQYIGGKLYVEKAESVTGELTAYKQNSKNKNTSLTVEDTKYTVSNIPMMATGSEITAVAADYDAKTNLEVEATFYLDSNGYIVAVGEVDEAAYSYAYIKVAAAGTTKLDDDRVKVVLPDGTTATYVVSDKGLMPSDKDTMVKDGAVLAYTMTGNNEIKLIAPKGTANATAAATFSKGKTSITGTGISKTVYATTNTVFYYVDGDDVSVYTGYKNAPTVDAAEATAAVALNKVDGNKAMAVVFDGAGVATASVSDNLFLYKTGSSTKDYTEATVFLAGQDEPTEIKVSDVKNANGKGGQPLVSDRIYLFSIDSDDYYVLSEPKEDNLVSHYDEPATAEHVSNSTIDITGAGELEILKDTILVDNTDNPGTPSVTLGGVPGSDDKIAGVLYNGDNEALIVVIDNTEEGQESETPDNVTVTVANGKITLTYTGKTAPSVDEQATAVVEKLTALGYTDIDVPATEEGLSVKGITAKKGVITYTFTYDVKAAE